MVEGVSRPKSAICWKLPVATSTGWGWFRTVHSCHARPAARGAANWR